MVADLEARAGGEAVGTAHAPAAEAFPAAALETATRDGLVLAGPAAGPPAPRGRARRRAAAR
jgi:hypothetical protein